MITVTAAIIEKGGRIFAARRAPGKHLEGLWEFPGGKLEPGESPEQCLARELKEEFGVKTNIGEFVGESIYDYGEKVIRLIAYRAVHEEGEFQLRDHDKIKWLAIEDFHSLDWAPADIPLLKNARLILDGK